MGAKPKMLSNHSETAIPESSWGGWPVRAIPAWQLAYLQVAASVMRPHGEVEPRSSARQADMLTFTLCGQGLFLKRTVKLCPTIQLYTTSCSVSNRCSEYSSRKVLNGHIRVQADDLRQTGHLDHLGSSLGVLVGSQLHFTGET